ncbi:MAG: hypothetical protein ACREJP_09390, partial [Candidatus Methylomirabilales bacterium]
MHVSLLVEEGQGLGVLKIDKRGASCVPTGRPRERARGGSFARWEVAVVEAVEAGGADPKEIQEPQHP